jgi:hypothetical protein
MAFALANQLQFNRLFDLFCRRANPAPWYYVPCLVLDFMLFRAAFAISQKINRYSAGIKREFLYPATEQTSPLNWLWNFLFFFSNLVSPVVWVCS